MASYVEKDKINRMKYHWVNCTKSKTIDEAFT